MSPFICKVTEDFLYKKYMGKKDICQLYKIKGLQFRF